MMEHILNNCAIRLVSTIELTIPQLQPPWFLLLPFLDLGGAVLLELLHELGALCHQLFGGLGQSQSILGLKLR